MCLIEIKINPVLISYTFSIRDKLFRNKESTTILLHNEEELLDMRQQGEVFTRIISQTRSTAISIRLDLIKLGR